MGLRTQRASINDSIDWSIENQKKKVTLDALWGQRSYKPWNMGQTFLNIDKLPTPKYWPKEYSMNSRGMPMQMIIIT